MLTHSAIAEIDEAALRHNLKIVKQRVDHSRILAMIKSNAYGHDVASVINGLQTADGFGVANLHEALPLREWEIAKPVVILQGFQHADELALISEKCFDIVVHHEHQVHALEKAKLARPVKVWLKIDTGMHRLGLMPHEIQHVWSRLQTAPAVAKPLHVMTHFADADQQTNNRMQQQFHCFQELLQGLAGHGHLSIANSAALWQEKSLHLDWVRPGILLYGVSPFADQTGLDLQLKPVMTLRSTIIAVRHCEAGDLIGYGGDYRCEKAKRVGVVAIGYGDGYPRHAKTGTPVCVNGTIVPLLGRVSMDLITVDLDTLPHTQIGDPVILWGNALPVEHVAAMANTIPYELLCQVTRRVKTVLLPIANR